MIRIIACLLLLLPLPLAAKVKIVTSTADLAHFAQVIGGDLIEVEAIASPTSDIHFVEVRPSYMVKVARADVVLKIGLELDLWMDRIIDGSRNNSLTIIDCSRYIEPFEVPTFKADARHGDLHPYGNPHYWLSPANVEPITRAILEGLTAVDPESSLIFRDNRDRYLESLQHQLEGLKPKIQRLADMKIVFYHNSWPYFNTYVGIEAIDFIEPYPGVPPSPSHIKHLTELVRGQSIRVIGVEPHFDRRVPEKIAGDTGAKVITLYPSIGGRAKDESYVEWFEGNVDALLGGLQ